MESTKGSYNAAVLKFILFSGIGAIMFFVNVDIGGVSVIPIQHIINLIKKPCGPVIPYFTLLMVMAGGIMPIVNGSYKTSKFNFVFTAIKLLGTVIGIMAVFQIGPESIMRADMVPFLFNSVVVPIALMIPVTGVAYVMLLNFGLVEFISAFMQPVMRKIWKTPGESAIDAVVSFSGGYALAVLLTNDLYKKGVYSAKESVIIATGFSTVSISFLIVIANTLGFMEHWTLYFFACFFVTFFVTAVTARIYPIAGIPNAYYEKTADSTMDYSEPLFKRAWHAGVSKYQGRERCNDFSIGIELEGTDTTPYTDAQYEKLVAVTQTLIGRYPAIADNITRHSDIAPERKTDPGPAFDWSRFHAMLTTSSDKEIT